MSTSTKIITTMVAIAFAAALVSWKYFEYWFLVTHGAPAIVAFLLLFLIP